MNYSSAVMPRSFPYELIRKQEVLCYRVEALQTRSTDAIHPLAFIAQEFPLCGKSYDETRLYALLQCFGYITTNDRSVLAAVKIVTRVIYATVAERIQRKLPKEMGPTKLTDLKIQNSVSFR